MRKLPIGIFDSGVGGLTVLKAVSEILPNEHLLYLGDTARVPYGTRSTETIARYTLNAAGKLVDMGVKMLVIACNTATSAALPLVAAQFAPMPVIGVVDPGAEAACAATKSGSIAVIATEATISQGAYQTAIRRLMPDAVITTKACTLLVSLAEEGWLEGEPAQSTICRYLGSIFPGEDAPGTPDTLLLGCTHFPLFRKTLQTMLGKKIRIVDSATATAAAIRSELTKRNLQNPDSLSGTRHFHTTDNPARFARTGSLFLGTSLGADDVVLLDL